MNDLTISDDEQAHGLSMKDINKISDDLWAPQKSGKNSIYPEQSIPQKRRKDLKKNDHSKAKQFNPKSRLLPQMNAVSHKLLDPLPPASSSLSSQISLSGSEADFLSRQLQHSLSLPLPAFHSTVDIATPTLPIIKSRSAGGSDQLDNQQGYARSIDSYKENILQLEKKIGSLETSVHNKEKEIVCKDEKIRSLANELEQMRRASISDMKRIQSDHELEILRIKEQFMKEKSILLSASSTRTNNQIDNSIPQSFPGNNKLLLDQLEMLRAELRKSQELYSDEKKSLIASFNLQLSNQDRRLKSEILDLKNKNSQLEEAVHASNDQSQSFSLQIAQLKNKIESLEQEKQDAIQEQLRLRNDLKNMQQSVQSTYRFDSSVERSPSSAAFSPRSQKVPSFPSVLPTDIETAMKLHDAKYEAKLRQMQNKLEFLKSQLETERRELDETKSLLSNAMNERERLIQAHERKLQDRQREFDEQLLQREQKIAENYEKRMIELANLQKQFLSVTNQSNELQQQNSLITQQMESSQAIISRLQLQVLNYQTELDQNKKLLSEYEQDKAQEMVKENQKVSQDTLIKRLDNERNYLKSQLKSEIVLKNEIQAMLDESNRVLKESQNQWSKDVEKLRQEIQSMQQASHQRESQYALNLKQMEQEKQTSQQHSAELKQAFQKCRDQLKMEQLALEQITSLRDHVQQQVSFLQHELQQEKDQLQSTHQHYQKQIEAIQLLMSSNEEKIVSEKKLLQDELRHCLEQNSSLSNELMEFKEQKQVADTLALRKLFLLRIVKINYSFDRIKVHRSFKKWLLNNSLMKIANQFKQQMEVILSKVKADNERDKQQALLSQRQELTFLKIEEISKASEDWRAASGREKEHLLREYEERFASLEKQHTAIVKEMENDHRFDVEKLQKQFESTKKEFSDNYNADRERLIKEHQKEISLLKYQFYEHELVQSKNAVKSECEAHYFALLAEKQKEWEESVAVEKRNKEIEMDYRLYEKQKQLEETLRNLKDKHDQEKILWRSNQDFLLDKQKREDEEKLLKVKSDLIQQHEEQIRQALQQCRNEMHEQYEQQLQQLKTVWQEEYEDRLIAETQKAEELSREKLHLAIREKEMETQSFAKQETKKWKTILQDQIKSQELEIQKVILQTKNECAKQFQTERELLLKNIELEKMKEKDFYSVKLQEYQLQVEKEKSDLIENERQRLRQEKSDFEAQLKQTFQKDFDEQFTRSLLKKTEEFDRLLSIEHKRHDSLKEDFAKQMKLFAKERDSLIKQHQQLEKQLEVSEAIHNEALNSARIKQQEEKDKLTRQFEEEKRRLAVAAEQSYAVALSEQKDELQRQYATRIEVEKETMQNQFDLQLTQIQQENERLMKQLDNALTDLKKEKQHLTDDLAGLSNQLQETEDALFDCKSAKEQLQTSKSLLFWQCMTKLQLLKLRFQKGVQEFDSEAKKRFQALQVQLTNQWNDLALQYMKTAAIVFELDQRRLSLLQRFNQSKQQEEMQHSKKSIQLLEYEIDKLHSEKQSLEENKAILLKEIDGLTQEIHEQEEMIRQHHAQESAMTIHGRVNIVFARKKRRLDQEIERLLELMETKRNQITEIDDKIISKVKLREEKELLLIQFEQQFIAIIIQQQKEIYKELVDWQSFADRAKAISQLIHFPFPPIPATSTSNSKSDIPLVLPEITPKDVLSLVEQWKQEDSRKEMMNNWKE